MGISLLKSRQEFYGVSIAQAIAALKNKVTLPYTWTRGKWEVTLYDGPNYLPPDGVEFFVTIKRNGTVVPIDEHHIIYGIPADINSLRSDLVPLMKAAIEDSVTAYIQSRGL